MLLGAVEEGEEAEEDWKRIVEDWLGDKSALAFRGFNIQIPEAGND